MTETFENGYAVIIGVDQNQIEQLKLPTVAKDVEKIRDVLVHPQRCAYKADNVKLIKGEDAKRREILDALFWLQEKIAADRNATAVVYYSGHGMFDTAANQYYLIPFDIPSVQRLRASAIKAEEFTAGIADIQAKRLLVLLDCCHAAGIDAKAVELIAEAPHLKQVSFPMDLPETQSVPVYEEGGKGVHDLAEGQGRAILNSSTGAESSYIRRDGQMSLFTYHLIEALTGHAARRPEDRTVLVTDVMGYVTREVAKTAANEGREQTPVMRTTGVFPVALVLGGEGAKGVDTLPDPLEPLPQAAGTVFNQEGQSVGGDQFIVGGDASIEQVGDRIETGGGAYIGGKVDTGGGNFAGRDMEVHNENVTGDKIDGGISVGSVSGGAVSIGHKSQATYYEGGASTHNVTALFAPLLRKVSEIAAAEGVQKVQALKEEASKGKNADDQRVATLIEEIADLAPGAVETLLSIFTTAPVSKVGDGATKYVLGRLRSRQND